MALERTWADDVVALREVEADNKALRERVAELEKGLNNVLGIGHNDECLFCGFKDKYALAALDREGEG